MEQTIEPFEHPVTLPGKIFCLVDGQFGSTGKGLLAAYLATMDHARVDIATTNSSANAGHTTKFADGMQFVTYHLPTFGIIQEHAEIYLNAGSIIDVDLLLQEIEEHGIHKRLAIHPMAAIIKPSDKSNESHATSHQASIASTQKGVGAALARKILRGAETARNIKKLREWIKPINLNEVMLEGLTVSMEVPQGYSLSLNGPFYPYCTSRQCTVAQGLSDAQVNPRFLGVVAMSLRTYPIRVGHLYDDDGTKIGDSGPCYPDQEELTWKGVGQPPELTTVTQRERRIFTLSDMQMRDAMYENRPDIVFLNFMNYCRGVESMTMPTQVKRVYKDVMTKDPVMLYGHGPNVEDISNDSVRGKLPDDSGHGEGQNVHELPQRPDRKS